MMKLIASLALASAVNAHTLFTTLYINGRNQGDGTCVRMPKNGATGTAPIYPITGDAMACGYGGRDPVPFVCPAPSGAQLTFVWREWPDGSHPGSIDVSHKGPCAVYVKRVADMFVDPAAGPGWLKIWEDGYDGATREWCTDRLRRSDGLMSVDLPAGLAAGYYLVRPEILALHEVSRGDPQFYTGCAQVYIQGGGGGGGGLTSTTTKEDEGERAHAVSIPGFVNKEMPGLKFDIYKEPMPAYPMYGPDVYVPAAPAPAPVAVQQQQQQEKQSQQSQQQDPVAAIKGAVPKTCLLKNANWCARPLVPARYTDQTGCWAAVKDCYEQSEACRGTAPASGSENCGTWETYCGSLNDGCERGEFEGPPAFTGREVFAGMSGGGGGGAGGEGGSVPAPWGKHFTETTAATAAATTTFTTMVTTTATSTVTTTATTTATTSMGESLCQGGGQDAES